MNIHFTIGGSHKLFARQTAKMSEAGLIGWGGHSAQLGSRKRTWTVSGAPEGMTEAAVIAFVRSIGGTVTRR